MTNEELKEIGISALRVAYDVHEKLGKDGEEMVMEKEFGEPAVRADVVCEKAIIELLREKNVPIKVVSEEHGTVVVGEKPKLTGILDGLDGSGVYKKARGKGRYGTMFAILSGVDPKYNDYIFSGVMEHVSNKLYFATKNSGSFLVENGTQTQIACNHKIKLDKDCEIYIDEWWEINRETFSDKLKGYNTHSTGSLAIHYVDVACGKADFSLESTHLQNLEMAVAFGLISEAGGAMITIDGQELGEQRYFEFGRDEHIPIITAPTKDLALDLLNYLELPSY